MKEYRKPTLSLIKFEQKDVLSISAAKFDINWLEIL
jgi:hypothetical protein